jgi:preprotein translocase subunit SecB
MTEILQKISHLIAAVQLQSVRLAESTVKSSIRSPKEAGKIDLFVDTSTQIPEMEDGLIYVRPTINTVVMSQDKTVVSLTATFELVYIIQKQDVKITQDQLNDFGRLNAMFNVWPYWREFVQNTVTRMNLPPLVLPLFRIKEAVKQVEQAQASPQEAAPAKS